MTKENKETKEPPKQPRVAIFNATGSDFICNEKRYPAGAETVVNSQKEAEALGKHPTAVIWLESKMLIPIDLDERDAKAAEEAAAAAEAKAAEEAAAAKGK